MQVQVHVRVSGPGFRCRVSRCAAMRADEPTEHLHRAFMEDRIALTPSPSRSTVKDLGQEDRHEVVRVQRTEAREHLQPGCSSPASLRACVNLSAFSAFVRRFAPSAIAATTAVGTCHAWRGLPAYVQRKGLASTALRSARRPRTARGPPVWPWRSASTASCGDGDPPFRRRSTCLAPAS